MKKYYIRENNRLYCNGDIVVGDKPEGTACDLQHAFTTHSIQGETANHNLFIDSSRMFESRMFYTAISRAKYLNQIYIIDSSSVNVEVTNAIIYKIVSKSGVYIGSTTKTIEARFKEHKQSHLNASSSTLTIGGMKSLKQYFGGADIKQKKCMSHLLIGDDDVCIKMLEEFKVINKKELLKKEAEYINKIVCVNKTFKNDVKRCGEFL